MITSYYVDLEALTVYRSEVPDDFDWDCQYNHWRTFKEAQDELLKIIEADIQELRGVALTVEDLKEDVVDFKKFKRTDGKEPL
jgi:hypothetical protein